MTLPAPPDQAVWWDTAEVVARVKRELRLRQSPAPDLDEQRWAELADTAGEMINVYLDRTEAPAAVPQRWMTAQVRLVIELADSGVTMSQEAVTSFLAGDPMTAVVAPLRGSKQRWGIG